MPKIIREARLSPRVRIKPKQDSSCGKHYQLWMLPNDALLPIVAQLNILQKVHPTLAFSGFFFPLEIQIISQYLVSIFLRSTGICKVRSDLLDLWLKSCSKNTELFSLEGKRTHFRYILGKCYMLRCVSMILKNQGYLSLIEFHCSLDGINF
jgi:hypothetical protein